MTDGLVSELVNELREHRPRVVAIGASAGAVEALKTLLPLLPASFPASVVIVVHVPPDRPNALPELFGAWGKLPVFEAQDKESMRAGVVYFAPPNYHLLVERDGSLSLSVEEPVHFSRPSVDVLFITAAWAFGPSVLGVILSGANADGAQGLATISHCGGLAWVQNPRSARATPMPLAAIEKTSTARVLDLAQMAAALTLWAEDKS